MKIFRRKQFILLSGVFLVVGTVGAIGFFPFNFQSQYTCIYHRFFCENMMNQTQCAAGARMSGTDATMGAEDHTRLLNRYLIPFGFLWWGSIGLLVGGIYLTKVKYSGNFRKKQRRKLNEETV